MTAPLLVVAAVAGVATWFGIGPVLRALPEPADAAEGKIPYTSLPTVRFRSVTALCVVASLALSAVLVGWPVGLAWVALGSVGVWLAAVDARTTYLPGRLMQVAWALAAVGLVFGGWLAGWQVALNAAVGAAVLGALFWLLWRVTGGLGFGDVRLTVLVGATAGTLGLQWLLTAALLGSIVGVVWGLVATRGYHRSQPFAYGPSLVIGPYLALLVAAVVA